MLEGARSVWICRIAVALASVLWNLTFCTENVGVAVNGGPSLRQAQGGALSLFPVRTSERLFQWEPSSRGHVRDLWLGDQHLTMQTLSLRPKAFLVKNFFTSEEASELIAEATREGWQPAITQGRNSSEAIQSARTAETAALSFHDVSPFRMNLSRRISAVTQMPLSTVRFTERFQVSRYAPGGFYHGHYDSASRYITLMLALEEATEGGETCFQLADKSLPSDLENIVDMGLRKQCTGLVVKAPVGSALLWYNYHTNDAFLGEVDANSLHAGCPVKSGRKSIGNAWIKVGAEFSEFYGRSIFVKFNRSISYYGPEDTDFGSDPESYLVDPQFYRQPGRGLLMFIHDEKAHADIATQVDSAALSWAQEYEEEGLVPPLRFASVAMAGSDDKEHYESNKMFVSESCASVKKLPQLNLPAVCVVEPRRTGLQSRAMWQSRLMAARGDEFNTEKLLTFLHKWEALYPRERRPRRRRKGRGSRAEL